MKHYNQTVKTLLAGSRLVFIFCICIQIFACKKYLEEKRTNSTVIPSTIEDLQALLDNSEIMNQRLTPSLGEASADDYFLQQTTYDSRTTKSQQFYIWQPYDYVWQNDWSYGYTPVLTSNLCLELLEKIPVTSQNQGSWNNVKGSALFFRAYNFLNLTWNHAKAYDESTSNTDLGIALRLGSDFNVASVRASVKECYERIITDAKEAVSYLVNIPSHVFRPSRAAAYGLLARAYLSMRQYDSAFKYADLCLGIKSDLFDYNLFNANPSGTSFSPYQYNLNKEIIFYTEMNNSAGTLGGSTSKTDTLLYSSYASNDQREIVFFRSNNGYKIFRGSYSGAALFFSGIATDEMFLTRAECSARGINGSPGDKDAALADLNTLLANRYNATFVPVTAATATDALNRILLERRKELVFRGLRWMDIKRLNKEGANIIVSRIINGQTYTLEPNANYYALPLPADIINSTGIPQNPE